MLNEKPVISIITPSCNSGLYIENCIQSIIFQNSVAFEHIIIDCNSTDSTIEILKRYSHLRWISEKDFGQSDALNKGFQIAKGQIIGWLNADEVYLPGTFTKILSVFKEYPGYDVVYGEIIYSNEKLKPIRRKYDHKFDKKILIYVDCIIPSASTFYKRRFVDEQILLDITLKTSMDYDFFCNLASRGYRFLHIPVPLSIFRIVRTSSGSTFASSWKRELLQIRRNYSNIPLKNTFLFPLILMFMKAAYLCKRAYLKIRLYGIKVIFKSKPITKNMTQRILS